MSLSFRPVPFLFFAATSLLLSPLGIAQRLNPAPPLRPGQVLFYRIDFTSSRAGRTESRVATAQGAPVLRSHSTALLQVEIMESTASALRVKTFYSEHQTRATTAESPDKKVEFSLSPKGDVSQVIGLDQLSAAQQLAWNEWLASFTAPMAFPNTGVALQQKWETSEPETNPSPIASLSWSKKFHYVRDEDCPAPFASQSCSVILVSAVLRQRSSPHNATPDDYKARNLKTRGTASGRNEVILYVLRSQQLLVRSTATADQVMDAIVALADGSNQARYSLTATSHSEISLLPDSAPR